MPDEPVVRPLGDGDRDWAREVLVRSWGSTRVARLGEVIDLAPLPGFVALVDGVRQGLVTYALQGDACEVATLDSLAPGRGVGRALLGAVAGAARAAGCRRIWLITTNDNTRALRIYQQAGWDLVALHRGAVDEARRRLKPEISELGEDGIPIRHELELELRINE
jgi:ribosomal protein S18 acetylase RimI-like enzyme